MSPLLVLLWFELPLPVSSMQGTYTLEDQPGLHDVFDSSSRRFPRCSESLERILATWRGRIVVEYGGDLVVRGELWDAARSKYPRLSGSKRSPRDPAYRVELIIERRATSVVGGLVIMDVGDDDTITCASSLWLEGGFKP